MKRIETYAEQSRDIQNFECFEFESMKQLYEFILSGKKVKSHIYKIEIY
jgi:hypothetical protein